MIDTLTNQANLITKTPQSPECTFQSFSPRINKLTGGYFEGSTTLIGGRTGMGVYRFLCNEAINFAQKNKKVLFISPKRSLMVATTHLLASLLNIEPIKLFDPNEREGIAIALEALKPAHSDLPIIIADGTLSSIPINQFEACDILIICGFHEWDNYQIPYRVRELQKQYRFTTLLGLWLGKGIEERGGDCRPRLMDIPNSYEAICDNVYLIYRPEYYGITEDEDGCSTANRMELWIKKSQLGVLSEIWFHFKNGLISECDELTH